MGGFAEKVKNEIIMVTVCDSPKVDKHSHEFLELAYVINGKAAHTLGEESSVIKKGDYFIVDYGTMHDYSQIGEEPFTVINCLFVPRLIDETLRRCRNFEQMVDNYLIKFSYKNLKDRPTKFIYHDDGKIGELIYRLKDEYDKKEMGYKEVMRCILIEILIDTMRSLRRPENEELSDIVKHIKEEINKNFMEQLSLKELAKECPYTLGLISRRFKEETGVSFKDYLQSVRVWEAERLLSNTNKKVAEIATLVGYNDIKFFGEVFKDQTGVSPSQWRKQG